MRADDAEPEALFSYITPSQRVPQDHPLRRVREIVDKALEAMSGRFQKLYSRTGRPSIPPEKLIRALLLQVLYTIRSERQLVEHIEYNILFRWFVGLGLDDRVWDATTFTKNRDRLMLGAIDKVFFEEVLAEAAGRGFLSNEHFTVDGTLVEAWAGQKSFQKKGDASDRGSGQPPDDPGNPSVNFRGEQRTNDTHQSTTDPESRLYRKAKGHEAKLSYMGHVVIENRNGLVVAGRVTQATGKAERETALNLIDEIPRGVHSTLGGDKGYDTRDFVAGVRERGMVPHVAQNTSRRASAIDARTTRHTGYKVSQRRRKRVEEVFGWLKTVGTMRKTRHRGVALVDWVFNFGLAAYNLIRIRNLMAVPA
jgi:transposase